MSITELGIGTLEVDKKWGDLPVSDLVNPLEVKDILDFCTELREAALKHLPDQHPLRTIELVADDKTLIVNYPRLAGFKDQVEISNFAKGGKERFTFSRTLSDTTEGRWMIIEMDGSLLGSQPQAKPPIHVFSHHDTRDLINHLATTVRDSRIFLYSID